ncbi:MAG: type IV pilin [Candidatus Pacearchaeota archaeon]
MQNKKGLSEVVTNVLIILLVIIAIGIVWAFVSPLIFKAGTQATQAQACLGLDVKPVACVFTGGSVYNVSVTRSSQSADIEEVIFVFEKQSGETISRTQTAAPDILGTKIYSLDAGESSIKSVAVAVRLKGATNACQISAKQACA